MKGDFSRLTFDVTKHFSRVLMQQGRVQLDADWNEQTAILLHYLQTLAKDLIGEHGGPDGNSGFEIIKLDDIKDDFLIGHGRYYVSGILAENEPPAFPITRAATNSNITLKLSASTINDVAFKEGQYLEIYESSKPTDTQIVKITVVDLEKLELTIEPALTHSPDMARRAITYKTQADFPLPDTEKLENDNVYLVYLDLWERHITYIEDDSIREVALGGPDTTTRAKTVGQVKIINKYWEKEGGTYKATDIPNSQDNWRTWVSLNWSGWLDHWQPANRGLLKAQAKQDRKKDDHPCITSPESSYRGTENQLYRVEIHQAGIAWNGKNDATSNKESAATFKWSCDNGSVVTGVKLSGTELTVDNPSGLSEGKWLELTNDNQELRGDPGLLIKIKRIECDTVTLDVTGPILPPKDAQGEVWPTKARLWESDQITITESNGNMDKAWHKLENGVQLQFQSSKPANQYRTGDYWLIPARVATGDVEWPGEVGNPEPLPPHGVEHHYAPLAIIKITNTGTVEKIELRKKFEPSAKDLL